MRKAAVKDRERPQSRLDPPRLDEQQGVLMKTFRVYLQVGDSVIRVLDTDHSKHFAISFLRIVVRGMLDARAQNFRVTIFQGSGQNEDAKVFEYTHGEV